MSILKNAILIILVIASIQGLILKPSENYTNHVELADNYDLYWKNDQEKITFELHFTSKWALFGISDDSYADFITGWLTPDLKSHFNDHYGNLSKFESFVDNEANWLPIVAKKRENTTILKFSRNVKLCDETRHDLDIEKGQMNVVFATGDEFLDEKHIKYNKTQIGNLKLALIDSENEFSCGNLIKDQSTFGSKPTDTYQNFVDFIPGVYRLYWNITKMDSKNSSDMIGEIHCKTDGWVGFGVSPNGGMDSSDVVIAWSRNGSANFTDRYIQRRDVFIDKHQDWFLLKSLKSNGYSIYQFKRPVVLSDSEDRTIESKPSYAIFAFGDSIPDPNDDISYHKSNRGSLVVQFLTTSN